MKKNKKYIYIYIYILYFCRSFRPNGLLQPPYLLHGVKIQLKLIYVNSLRHQCSVSAIFVHCLTPVCWCHRTGMSKTFASIAAPSSASSHQSHEASPTSSRGSSPPSVSQCKSAPPPGQCAVCRSTTGSASVAGRVCRRSPRHKRMPSTKKKHNKSSSGSRTEASRRDVQSARTW